MSSTLGTYRRQVHEYFRLEFSDVPLKRLLLQYPANIERKVAKLIQLFYRQQKPPADAAGRIARLLRYRLQHFVVGQADD
jgi:hypothetical protein